MKLRWIHILRIFFFFFVVLGIFLNEAPTGMDLDFSAIPAFRSPEHILGTDILGRDVYSLVSYGVLSSVLIAIPVRVLTLLFSVAIAVLAYTLGKSVEFILDNISYVFLSVPSLLIALLVAVSLEDSFLSLPLAVILSDWAYSYEAIRSRIREIRESSYVSLTLAMGAGKFFIFRNHIIPGIYSTLVYLFMTGTPVVIMTLALLSFLGVDWSRGGMGPGLGEQIAFSADYFDKNPWAVYSPILGIVLLVISFRKI